MSDDIQGGLFDMPSSNESNEQITLGAYAERAYLDYAVSVVKGRALPDVSDGQKPVQRRILFAMHQMGLSAGAKPVKSARVVGDVLGKYHPHGDSAAYEALVRMAQGFSLRYPLIDGQGNFGSRDGDGAAAMRYTEARLTPIARLLLDEVDMGTVDFVPNYDGSQVEPKKLPARLPMVLLNGASGIAVGMATEIPSHQLNEVARACIALIKDPELSDETIAELIPGPDFPSGGQIITPAQDIATIYRVGRGSIKVRARWEFEDLARGQWQLVINELPPAASGQRVLEEIEELTNPKIKTGKKALTAEQQQTKALLLSMLDTVRDESGKDASVRLVFEPKTAKVDRQEFVNILLAHTCMESSASINLVMVGNDGRPRQKSMREILTEWIVYRQHTVTRRSQHRLDKVMDRIHVLDGRMIVYLNVDEVIAVIRQSDEPRPALMERFHLSERQAEDILEMRLRQLAGLEAIKIEQELSKLKEEAEHLRSLLDHPHLLKRLLIKEIEADAKLYGDERRTLIQEAERAVLDVKVVDEPVTVVISARGWLRARQGHGHEATQFTFKPGDSLYACYECRTTDTLVAISNSGRLYSVPVSSLPSARGDGQPINSMIELEHGTQIVHMLAGHPESTWLIYNDSGLGFSCRLSDMTTRLKGGKQFIRLEDNEAIAQPCLLDQQATHLGLLSQQGRLLVFSVSEIKVLSSGGRGTILMDLEPKDKIAHAFALGALGLKISGIYRNKPHEVVLATDTLAPFLGKRARKGKLFESKIKDAVYTSLR